MIHYSQVLLLTKEQGLIFSFSFVAVFFVILLISGIRRTAKLKEENRKLMESIEANLKDSTEDKYSDFTKTHSYKQD